jgi:putative glycosyltransferase (TIGR04348 family)
MHRPQIVIVSPGLAALERGAHHGNWQTASRWAQMLASHYRVRLAEAWSPEAVGDTALLIALHARRSAPSVAAWRARGEHRPAIVVLTGTDLYRDIDHDASAQRTLADADALVVLNELGLQRLPAALRARGRVVLQSCTARQALPKPSRHLRAVMVGHLRDEKDPATYFRAATRLADRPDIRLDHIGAALDARLGAEAQALAERLPGYRWLVAMPHGEVRRRIQAAHLLVHPSRMEGGAHVVIEAIRSGTPVLASRIDGNLGLLGADYLGLFEPGDDAQLATLLAQARDDPDMLARLQRQLAPRADRFAPETERATLLNLVAALLDSPPRTRP